MSEPNKTPGQNTDLAALLSEGQGGKRRIPWLVIVLVLLAAAAGAYFYLSNGDDRNAPRFATQAAGRGNLVVTVTATGNLEPTNQVEIGSELSGTVRAVLVDEDDRVEKGQVLVELDPAKFEDAVTRTKGAVAVAEASVAQAKATLDEARTKLERFREVARLSDNKVPSRTEMEAAEAEFARATANRASAQASLMEARAQLRSNETDLAKTKIKSPMDGVVLSRAVDPGQAVAASLQAVTLFILAEDLSQMGLSVDIDEADVGQVAAGMGATFTVDAWPDRTFDAEITRVGFNATDTDGVISYPAILKVNNEDLSLRPGMTATAQIATAKRDNVLLVPNAALRFTPPAPQTGEKADQGGGGLVGAMMPRRPRRDRNGNRDKGPSDTLYVLRGDQAVALHVETGVTDGRMTEITGGELQDGDAVITDALGTGR